MIILYSEGSSKGAESEIERERERASRSHRTFNAIRFGRLDVVGSVRLVVDEIAGGRDTAGRKDETRDRPLRSSST